jgi:acyl-CoA reductase-like NAD-dependent aldehyde dehydrogenase
VGDPLSEDTDLGPIVNASGLKTIDSQAKDSVKEGAEILTGGEQIRSKGYFYKPTILKNVSPNMRVAQEEVFGPVAPIIVADGDIEAVRLANDSQYGLGASIWTEVLDKAEKLSRMVRSGIVTVNNVVISDPRVPFGGVKKSGFGRVIKVWYAGVCQYQIN